MLNLRTSITTVSFLLTVVCLSQLNVYKTYADYVAHKAKSYGKVEFKKCKGNDNAVLIFEHDGKDDVEIECADIWGFGYKEILFRVSKDSKYFVKKGGVQIGTPFVVMFLDDVVYYENAIGVLYAMKHERNEALLKGMCAALSKDLGSDMAAVPCYPGKWTDQQILLLVHAYPELKALALDLEALKHEQSAFSTGSFNYDQMRTYVKEFIENKKKQDTN